MATRDILVDVFVSWLAQRLTSFSLEELQTMLMGNLTPIQETRAGKELIAIGVEKGIEQGLEQGIEQGKQIGVEIGIRRGQYWHN